MKLLNLAVDIQTDGCSEEKMVEFDTLAQRTMDIEKTPRAPVQALRDLLEGTHPDYKLRTNFQGIMLDCARMLERETANVRADAGASEARTQALLATAAAELGGASVSLVVLPARVAEVTRKLVEHLNQHPHKRVVARMYFGAANEVTQPQGLGLGDAREALDLVFSLDTSEQVQYHENLIGSARRGYWSFGGVKVSDPKMGTFNPSDGSAYGAYLTFASNEQGTMGSRMIVWCPSDQKERVMAIAQGVEYKETSASLDKMAKGTRLKGANLHQRFSEAGGKWIPGLGGPMPMADLKDAPPRTVESRCGLVSDGFSGGEHELVTTAITPKLINLVRDATYDDVKREVQHILEERKAAQRAHGLLQGIWLGWRGSVPALLFHDELSLDLAADDPYTQASIRMLRDGIVEDRCFALGDVLVALGKWAMVERYTDEMYDIRRVMRTTIIKGHWEHLPMFLSRDASPLEGDSLDNRQRSRWLAASILMNISELYIAVSETAPKGVDSRGIRYATRLNAAWNKGLLPFLRLEGEARASGTPGALDEPHPSMSLILMDVVEACIIKGRMRPMALPVLRTLLFEGWSSTSHSWMNCSPIAMLAKAAEWRVRNRILTTPVPEGERGALWAWLRDCLITLCTSKSDALGLIPIITFVLSGPCSMSGSCVPGSKQVVVDGPLGWFRAVLIHCRGVKALVTRFVTRAWLAVHLDGERYIGADGVEDVHRTDREVATGDLDAMWSSFQKVGEVAIADDETRRAREACHAAESLLAEEENRADRLERESAERRREKKRAQQERSLRAREAAAAALARGEEEAQLEEQRECEAFVAEWTAAVSTFNKWSESNMQSYAAAESEKARKIGKERLLTRPNDFLALSADKQEMLRSSDASPLIDEMLALREAHQLHINNVDRARKNAKSGAKSPPKAALDEPVEGAKAFTTERVMGAKLQQTKKNKKGKGKKPIDEASSLAEEEQEAADLADALAAVEVFDASEANGGPPPAAAGDEREAFCRRGTLADVPNLTAPAVPESTVGGTLSCLVCFAGERTHIFVPCGHIACCRECAPMFAQKPCPVCREKVTQVVEIHTV